MAGADELIAPDLIVPELLNARWKVTQSGGSAPKLERVIAFLERLRLLPSLAYAREAAILAQSLGHPVYDCLYVAIAQRERATLLTLDERIARKLRAAKLARILR